MSGFFGFDSSLPERRPGQPPSGAGHGQQQRHGFGGFQPSNVDETFNLAGAGEEEDLAVYTWGEGMGGSLMEGGDDLNDETFGDLGDVGNDFQFSAQPAPAAPPKSKIASTASRYKPKAVADPFAFSEDDFYSSRRAPAKPAAKPPTKPKAPVAAPKPAAQAPSGPVESLWAKPEAPRPMWGAAPSSAVKPEPSTRGPPLPGQIKSLEEIEAEMSRMAMPAQEPQKPQVVSLEEIERQMMAAAEPAPAPAAAPPPPPAQQPRREPTPTQLPSLPGSGYASQQALLDSMFPELGAAPSGQPTGAFPPGPPGQPSGPPQHSPEEIARMQALHERISAKIDSMSKHNHLMGNSDKDFITRIQLSQLATADPYTSDFYAQVFSALQRRQAAVAAGQNEDGPTVVQVAPGFAFGVSGPAGNRFGKMGSTTMQKLSSQVKKLVESRAAHQKTTMGTAALQGALGRVTKGSVAAPRPVLAVPTSRPELRPVNALNQQTGITRQALARKQVMVALEELYDAVLELEQLRREMPPPVAIEESERWNAECAGKVEVIWRRLMVMEPLDVSNPHPFISLINPTKGQRLFPRLLRHLPPQQALTLLTLLIATYPQLDVVARPPPPPVADSSLLTKADRADRVRREAETDCFLHLVIPGVDMLIGRCNLGLVAGLVGICAQRMDVARVAATRPGVALFTALLSRAQSIIRAPPPDPLNPQHVQAPDPAEVDQWNKTYAYFLSVLLPRLADLFPMSAAQKAAFGPSAYLVAGDAEREGYEMERQEAEVWGLAAALAVNAPEEEQTNLVAALRDKILHTVQAARNPVTMPQRAEAKLRNVNMFLNGLGLDASMIDS